ncbi:MAG: anhydro-N-acetylmuramic acid kinase [Candidatus Rifleibacteriota bacterium]
MKQKTFKILGMMSGTSGDGIDGSLVEFGQNNEFKLLWHDSAEFTAKAGIRLQKLMQKADAREVLLGSSYVANLYADAVTKFFHRNKEKPDYLAVHGQTVWHCPEKQNWDGYDLTGSLQLMNGSLLALKTGLPVISNFREADMAAGGQGAPLVPFGDRIFFGKNMSSDRVILNVGGIANITVLKCRETGAIVSAAFDTGPGNMLMDAFCNMSSNGTMKFDENGKLGAQGEVVEPVVKKVLDQNFFKADPPKSTGREMFGLKGLRLILKLFPAETNREAIISTLLEITVRSVVMALLNKKISISLPAKLVVAGGGAFNRELLKRLKYQLKDRFEVITAESLGVPVMAREAMCFAALGNAFVRKVPANVPQATGARGKVILGQLSRPFIL